MTKASKEKRFFLEIVDSQDDKVVKEIDVTAKTPKMRERVEEGASINLNHERYFTRIVERES